VDRWPTPIRARIAGGSLALGATFVAQGGAGPREIPAAEFFVDMLTSALQPGEILTEIRFPKPDGKIGARYEKFNQRAIDWAIVGVAAQLVFDGDTIRDVGIGLTAVGATPVHASGAEEALRGQKWSGDLARAAAERASEGLDPPSDHRASAEYRLHLVRVLTRRALVAAAATAGVGAA